MKRDFDQIRRELDMEVVLQQYGYQLSSKTKPNDVWRVYKSGLEGDSQRFAVMTKPKGDYKGFVELNNTSLRGDVFEFIKYKEGDYKSAFRRVDQMLGNPEFVHKARQIEPLKPPPPRQYLNDEKLRQSNLIEEYGVTLLSDQHSDYLTDKRGLAHETLGLLNFGIRFLIPPGRAMSISPFRSDRKRETFLLWTCGTKTFKSFPPGQKGDALWKSNEHALLSQAHEFRVEDRALLLEKGTTGTVSKANGSLTFHMAHPEEGVLSIPIDKSRLEMIPTNRIIISESPIDSLSYHQLNPPQPGEYRRYVSAAGNPSGNKCNISGTSFRQAPGAIYHRYGWESARESFCHQYVGYKTSPAERSLRDYTARGV